MSLKAEKFDELMKVMEQNGDRWFTKEELKDENNTVVYHGRLDIDKQVLPVFVILDDSAFTYVRVGVTLSPVDGKQETAVLEKLNDLNQSYKVSKYYINEADKHVYMDISIPVLQEEFNPGVIVDIVTQVIKPHLEETYKDLLAIVKGGKKQ